MVVFFIMVKFLKISWKFEFMELLIDLLYILWVYYGIIEGDFKKYKVYNEEYKVI